MSDDRPVQHTPKHLEKESGVFDPRHPAASPFAVAQPAAGVVADDVEERGQNLRGGKAASEAASEYGDQREVLARQHAETLRRVSGVGEVQRFEVEDGSAKAVGGGQPRSDAAGQQPRPAQPAPQPQQPRPGSKP